MKYIDADKLKAEIERLHKAHSGKYGCDEVGVNLEYLENFIASLQQEQPDFDDVDPKHLVHSHYTKVRETKTGRVFWAEYSGEAAEWYEAGTGKAYSISDVEIVKEQPEVDLEKLKNKAELIANEIMIGVQANKYHTCIYNKASNDFNHSHLFRAALKGIEVGLNARKEK